MRFNNAVETKRRRDEETKCAQPALAAPSLRLSVSPSLRLFRPAFSLIEVMIVVVIIGILAGAVTFATREYLERAKRERARSDIATYSGAVDSFYLDQGRYPTNQEGLKALAPNFVKVIQNDPWGRPYQYVCPGRTAAFEIITYGADGREGGTGADADLSSADISAQPQSQRGKGP